MIVNAGIDRVICQKDYHASDDTKQIFREAGIELDIRDQKVEQYDNQ
jgi:dCMP deaminase